MEQRRSEELYTSDDDDLSFIDVEDDELDEDARRISIGSTVYESSAGHSSLIYAYNSPIDTPDTTSTSLMSSSAAAKPPLPTSGKPEHLRVRAIASNKERAELVRRSRKIAQVFGQTPGAVVYESTKGHRTAFSISANDSLTPWPPAEGTQPTIHLSANNYTNRRHSLPSPTSAFFSTASSDTPNGSRQSFLDFESDDVHGNTRPRFDDDSDTDTVHGNHHSDPASLSSSSDNDDELAAERRRKREKLAKLHRFLGSRVPTELVLGNECEETTNDLPPIVPLDINLDNMNLHDTSNGSGDKAWLRRRRSSSAAAFPEHWSDELDRLKEDLGEEEKKINVRRAHKMEQVFGVAPPQTLYHTRQAPSPSPSVCRPELVKRSASASGGPSDAFHTNAAGSKNMNQSAYIHKSSSHGPSYGTGYSYGVSKSSSGGGKRKKDKGSRRPGTADSDNSTQQLLDKSEQQEVDYGTISSTWSPHAFASTSGRRARGSSLVYTHYQHSLNSLNDILDRDDRESLAELHDYLNSTADIDFDALPPPISPNKVHHHSFSDPNNNYDANDEDEDEYSPIEFKDPSPLELKEYRDYSGMPRGDRRLSNASSLKSERRRSLPAPSRMSVLSAGSIGSLGSLASDDSYALGLPTPSPTFSPGAGTGMGAFQQRRRRAAKLTQFFGVNYRELIRDVLESIESGLERERKRGSMREDEVEDLLQKLRTLKTKRTGVL